MQVQVGSTLKYKGHECVCTSIEKRENTCFARQDSGVMEAELRSPANCHYISFKMDDFLEGDIINIACEWLELVSPGKQLYFVYTNYEVRKEGKENDNKAGDIKTETVGQRIEGGESVGKASSGQNSDPLHGYGQSGEGGKVSDPSRGEGEEHSKV